MNYKALIATLFVLGLVTNSSGNFPSQGEDYRYLENGHMAPQRLASWIAAQLRGREYLPAVAILSNRPSLQTKRNSELTNAIFGSEETQKLYRDGRK